MPPAPTLQAVMTALPKALTIANAKPSAAVVVPGGKSLQATIADGGGDQLLEDARRAMTTTFIPDTVSYRRVQVGSKVRMCAMRSPRDLLIERAVYEVLRLEQGWAHPMSFAYQPGRGTRAVSIEIRNRAWVYDRYIKFDVVNFFQSVRHTAVVKAVERVVPEEGLRQVLAALLKATEQPQSQGRGLGQGTVLAPLLGNLVLTANLDELFPRDLGCPSGRVSHLSKRVDPHLWRRLSSVALGLVRYSDDGLVPYQGDRADGEALTQLIRRALKPLGLKATFQMGEIDAGFEFLGLRYRPGLASQALRVSPGTDLMAVMADEAHHQMVSEGCPRGPAMLRALDRRRRYLWDHRVDVAHQVGDEVLDELRASVKRLETPVGWLESREVV